MTTVHSNSTRDALRRVENMVSMAGLKFPVHVIRDQMAATLNFVIQQARVTGGKRKVVSISEITGIERDVILLQDVFHYRQTGVVDGHAQGVFESQGVLPRFIERLNAEGVKLPNEMFRRRRAI